MRWTPRSTLAAIALVGLLGACGSEKDSSATTAAATATTTKAPTTTPAATGNVTVLAAASLTEAFGEIGSAFETEHPDAEVTFSFDASSALVTQILQGAPADTFASADQANMTKLTDGGGNQGAPVVFATNELQIIVAPGNPKGITTVADLAAPDITFVTAAPEVPIGKYTQQVFDKAGVTVTPASLEQNVKGIVTKVTAGEADAGIVYRTDVLAAGDQAEGVDVPADLDVIAEYPIVTTTESTNPSASAAFIAFVLSDQGQQILRAHGFGAP